MSAVRGIPNKIPEPEYAPVPSAMFSGAARKEIKAQNRELAQSHAAAKKHEETAHYRFSKAMSFTHLKTRKNCNHELAAAAHVREGFSYMNSETAYRPYENPMEYISDMWLDGHIDDTKAQKLLTQLQEDGEVKPTPDEERVAASRDAHRHISNVTYLEKDSTGFSGDYPAGSADKLKKKYKRERVLIAEGKEPTLNDDTPMGFLLQEAERGHINDDEFKIMVAWERKPERTHTTEELAALRNHVVQQLTSADTGLNKEQATLEAIQVVQQISGNDIDRALESAKADKPAAIGAATQRELERRSAPATEQGRG